MRTWMPTLTITLSTALVGCNSQPQSNATDRGHTDAHADSQPTGRTPNPRVRIERPSVSLVKFDETSATLSLYELPEKGARWMVSTPSEPNGVPVPRVYKFKGKLDPRSVSLFFTVPSGGVSGHVSLQDVLDAQKSAPH